MPKLRKGILAAVLAAMPALALAQQAPPASDNLAINAARAWTWDERDLSVAQFDGPVVIELDNVRMQADAAVIWIKRLSGVVLDTQQVEIALVGNVSLQQGSAKRTGNRLFVTAIVRNSIRINSEKRMTRDRSDAGVYQIATGMREESGLTVREESGRWRLPRPSAVVERPAPPGKTTPATPIKSQVRLRLGHAVSQRMPDDTLALCADGGIQITIRQEGDQLIQIFADRAVVFTNLKQLTDRAAMGDIAKVEDAVNSLYLEGDVRIIYTPKSATRPGATLEANHVFYDIPTDRAVLTEAVVHSNDPASRIPLVMRATLLKQLSREEEGTEYRMENSVLTTSSFATPTFAICSEKAYVRQSEADDHWSSRYNEFTGRNTTMELWGLPIIWLPYSGAALPERGFPLRTLDVGTSSRFGFFTRSEWGLFETAGRQPPRDLDMTYQADYLNLRGLALGLNASYHGSFFTGVTHEPWSYESGLRSYFVYDNGVDKFGGNRQDVDPADFTRGRIRWQHQQFLPDNWQVQLKTGWISDPTFLEEYFPEEYRGIEAQDTVFYAKHQKDTEAITLLMEFQPYNFVTTQEFAQEGFEVERTPEVGYYRTGETPGNAMTFFSANTVSRLHFKESHSTGSDLGYNGYSAGIASVGTTGVTEQYVDRGDFRQELDFPVTIARFRVMPYVMARYTGYDNAPDSNNENRLYGGGGMRLTTAFWKVDDDIQSEFWDVHRMRHVIEPEVHFFSATSTTDRGEVFVYDEPVDAINETTALQLALHQRWQTKRGGPGKWQSVDFFTWNVEGNFFFDQPDDKYLEPTSFRGLFFPSAPETSVPRNSINSDALWRLSDSTVVLADEQYNLDKTSLATASAGLAFRRGDRMTWYLGDRYIDELDSNIVSLMMNYEVSTKYSLGVEQSYDLGASGNVVSSLSIIRRFDVFNTILTVKYDQTTGDSGVYVSVRPSQLPSNVGSGNIPSVFGGK